MDTRAKKLSLIMEEISLLGKVERGEVLFVSAEEALPKRFPLDFRFWIRDNYYRQNINQTYSPKWKSIIANSLFKKETERTKRKIYEAWKSYVSAKGNKEEEEEFAIRPSETEDQAVQLELFGGSEILPQKIRKLARWLTANQFQDEAFRAIGLLKTSAGRPMPIDRSELLGITNELLDKLEDKLLDMEPVNMRQNKSFSPSDLHDHMLDSTPNYFKSTTIPPLVSTDPNFTEDEVLEEIKAVGEIYHSSLSREEKNRSLDALSERFNQPAEFLKKQYMDTRAQSLSNYLKTSVTREKNNIKGDSIKVTYTLSFKDQGPNDSDSRGAYTEGLDGSGEKSVYVFYSPNRYLHDAILKYREESGNFGGSLEGSISFEEKIKQFKDSLRQYVFDTLVHEEVHVLDVIKKDRRNYEKYEISSPGGESLEQVAKKLEIDAYRLFSENYNEVIEEAAPFIDSYHRVEALENLIQDNNSFEYQAIYDQVSTEPLKEGFELKVPHRAHSQVRVNSISDSQGDLKTRSLIEIAKQTGVKGGVERLFVINYKNLFSEAIDIPNLKTYNDIYYTFIKNPLYNSLYNKLIRFELEEGSEVKLIPSYSELYSFDKGFYASTKEEFKALFTEIMNELSEKFESDSSLRIEETRPEDLIEYSSIAQDLQKTLKTLSVDHLIKTPLGFLDKLKENRTKMFYSGINHIYYILKDRLSDSDGYSKRMEKEAVLKRRMRKTRGKGKRNRMEWGLFSKSNPKKVLKWFGTKKPSKKEVAKEERRVHSFASNILKKEYKMKRIASNKNYRQLKRASSKYVIKVTEIIHDNKGRELLFEPVASDSMFGISQDKADGLRHRVKGNTWEEAACLGIAYMESLKDRYHLTTEALDKIITWDNQMSQRMGMHLNPFQIEYNKSILECKEESPWWKLW